MWASQRGSAGLAARLIRSHPCPQRSLPPAGSSTQSWWWLITAHLRWTQTAFTVTQAGGRGSPVLRGWACPLQTWPGCWAAALCGRCREDSQEMGRGRGAKGQAWRGDGEDVLTRSEGALEALSGKVCCVPAGPAPGEQLLPVGATSPGGRAPDSGCVGSTEGEVSLSTCRAGADGEQGEAAGAAWLQTGGLPHTPGSELRRVEGRVQEPGAAPCCATVASVSPLPAPPPVSWCPNREPCSLGTRGPGVSELTGRLGDGEPHLLATRKRRCLLQ